MTSSDAIASSTLMDDGFFHIMDHAVLMGILGFSIVMALMAIFLFKNRKIQMRLTFVSLVATIAAIGFGVGIFVRDGLNKVEAVDWDWGLLLPVASILFLVLAYRFIQKDDKLVRSMDRLR